MRLAIHSSSILFFLDSMSKENKQPLDYYQVTEQKPYKKDGETDWFEPFSFLSPLAMTRYNLLFMGNRVYN